MAELKLGNIKPVGADNVVVESKYVKGGYVVVSSIAERDALKGNSGENIVNGSLCFCQADSKFYQYNGTNWAEKEFGTTTVASEEAAGLMSPDDKKKLDDIAANAEINVQADWNVTDTSSDAFIKNKPSIPSIAGLATESYADEAANKVKNDLLNGAGSAYDTLKELGDLIDENVDAIDALEVVAAGKADKIHTHPELVSSGTADPDASITSQVYFKYNAE